MATTAKKEEKGVQLQLTFDKDLYQEIQDAASNDNRRIGLVTRDEKIHTYKAVMILVGEGLLFRKHQIYVPEDKRKEFMKDDKFSKLLAKAQLAMESFKEYQDILLAK